LTHTPKARSARDAVAALPHLGGELPRCEVDLSDNTNLWGAPPAAVRALQGATSDSLSRYPSLYSEPLQAALLQYVGMNETSGVSAVTGCGSDDVLDSTMRAFGAPGDRIAFSSPTFSMIPLLARLNGLEAVPIPLTPAFDIDAERVVEAQAEITYICAPNNPTGTGVSRAAVEYVVQHAVGVVLIDEAYAEFAPEVFLDLVSRSDRVVIARTFSKAFGMAGLRVGYGVADGDVARLIERARGPYKVSRVAEQAVLAALEPTMDGVLWVREHAAKAVENRERISIALRELGLNVLTSAANFVMVPDERASALASALRAHGVGVRWFGGLPSPIPDFTRAQGTALRIGVGPWSSMQRLLDAFAEVLQCA
jgi:Histidinol-phosphate/aromatic aminotransferase and cobyric acid decarboxylase